LGDNDSKRLHGAIFRRLCHLFPGFVIPDIFEYRDLLVLRAGAVAGKEKGAYGE
jgi:hypothetical protein